MLQSDVTIEIDSRRCQRSYEVLRFSEFDIQLDIETDADAFDLVAENPNGIYTGLFSRFDNCRLKINGTIILTGNIDGVAYYLSASKDYIRISGRDLCWMLVDNDALPDTLENIVPKIYIERKCAAYGIKCNIAGTTLYEKLVIGCEESEISVFNKLIADNNQKIWYTNDTLFTGNWNTSGGALFVFTASSSIAGIPIKNCELREDGTDMVSRVIIYGSDGDGDHKVMGQFDNQYMITKGIKKRKIKKYQTNSAVSKYVQLAETEVKDIFREDTELKITVPIKGAYIPNTCARVVIDRIGLDAEFFIKCVQYVKGISGGSVATLTMILADSSFDKLWNSTNAISIVNFTPRSNVLANYGAGNVYSTESINGDWDDTYVGEIVEVLDNNLTYFPVPEYSGKSIVDALKKIGANGSYSYRSTIAEINGISDYKGTAKQNIEMLNKLLGGTLIKPNGE